MPSTMRWRQKVSVWKKGWLENTPLDQIRSGRVSNPAGGSHGWETLRSVMREFLTLDEDQSLLLPEPLRGIWGRWRSHQGDLRRGANLLKDKLGYEQPDIAGGSYFACRLSKRFKAGDIGRDGVIPEFFSWQTNQHGRVEVAFSAEREPEVVDLRAHTKGEEMWVTLDTIRARVADSMAKVHESRSALHSTCERSSAPECFYRCRS